MNDTAEWTDGVPAGHTDEKSFGDWRILLLPTLMLAICLAASLWIYFDGDHLLFQFLGSTTAAASSRGPAALDGARQFDHFTLRGAIILALAGFGFLATLVRALATWRGRWLKRLQAKEDEARKEMAKLESQLSDSRKSELQLQELRFKDQERAASFEISNSKLQEELDNLKRTERNLSQQRQALESSKSVLELHVQARTKELQKLQRRYEHILNSAGEGICGLDIDGKITFVNPAVEKITGWPLEELIGKTEQEIFASNGSHGHTVVDGQHLGEQVFHRKDGSGFPVEYVKTPINENSKVVGAVLVFKDITERKRVEETLAQKAAELARSNSELEQFAFVASHDLQEPLRKIQAFGDRLKVKVVGALAPETHDYLARMQSAAARMRTLIDDLLAFSRVIRSSEPFVPVDLGVVAKEVLGDLEVRIEKGAAQVEVGDLPTIEADPMQMRQLLLNLIGNALKFQPAGGRPVVKLSSRLLNTVSGEPLCELSFEDNGIGFDEKYTEKIFAVFQRLHGRNEYEGTGVGLAVCRRIADRHSGTIIARSQVGQGATFIVTLPMRHPKPQAPI